ACDDHPEACARLAELYRTGRGVVRDEAKAVEVYGRACEQGSARGCGGKALLVRNEDAAAARALFERSCDGGFGAACVSAAEMHEQGEGGPADAVKAAWLLKKGCERDDAPSCAALGERYAKGTGVAAD